MTRRDNEDVNRAVASFATELNRARRQAEEAMFEFAMAENYYKVGALNEHDLRERHLTFQATVEWYAMKIYPYIREKPDVVHMDLNPDGEELTIYKLLLEQGKTETRVVDSGDWLDPDASTERESPVLQPPNGLRSAVTLLNDEMLQLGFLPEPQLPDADPDAALV